MSANKNVFVFTTKGRHKHQNCKGCGQLIVLGDIVVSARTVSRKHCKTRWYHASCAIHLNVLTTEEVEEMLSRKQVVR